MKCSDCKGNLAKDADVVIVNSKNYTAKSLVRNKCVSCGKYFYIKDSEER